MHIVHGVPGTFPRDMAWRIGEEMKQLSLSAWLLLRCLQFALEFGVVHFAGGRGGGAQPKEKLSEQWKRTSNKLNHMWHQFRKSNSNHSQCLQRCAIPGPRAPATRFHWVRTTTHWATVLCDKPDKPFRVRLTSPLWSWHKFKSN